jgi:hypothetical protein
MNEPRICRLFGVRADGSCTAIIGELTMNEAERARLALEETGIFSAILIERNEKSGVVDNHDSAGSRLV